MFFRISAVLKAFLSLAIFCAALSSVALAQSYYNGIDVSNYQGTIDWSQVHDSGISFAFIKSTEGVTYDDPKFTTNIQGAHNAGVVAGAYHFARPDNGNSAVDEADHFVNIMGSYLQPGYLRPVLDVERGSELGKTALSAWVVSFVSRVVATTGVEPIIYCNSDYAKNYLDSTVAGYDLWLANWRSLSNPPTSSDCGVWDDWIFWQWSSTSSVPGISGNVDADVCRVNPSNYGVVPEPSTLCLLLIGACTFLLGRCCLRQK